MSKNQPSKRVQRARSEFSHRRPSMDSLKTGFRNSFLERLRDTRSKSADRLRRIVENCEQQQQQQTAASDHHDLKSTSFSALKSVLLAEAENENFPTPDEMGSILKEVEEELQQVSLEYEAEQYLNENDKETEDLVERLMDKEKCRVCDKLGTNQICPQCTADIRSEF